MFQQRASLAGAVRIDGLAAPVDVLDHAIAVDHEGRALGQPDDRHQDAVVPRDGLVLVAQEGKLEAELFRKGSVLGPVVDADPDDLGAGLLELGDISLIRRELLGSARGRRFDVKRQNHALLPAEVAQLHRRAVLVG